MPGAAQGYPVAAVPGGRVRISGAIPRRRLTAGSTRRGSHRLGQARRRSGVSVDRENGENREWQLPFDNYSHEATK